MSAMQMPDAPEGLEQDFALLGILDRAYVKRVVRNGEKLFEVHAADGSFLGQFHDRDTAFAALRLQDMEPLSVH
ncbi:DUF1150 family protein [Azospirillum sp.]|uniref:DUF1150 family protein n=1 Tax=Azospirillum sp. TaxID=34012 RepID=UPI002D3DBC47|nr:DUF1150 family protein [Azospirillum sp.]HYD66042.1 DUF1150 family protein [Azospirillum sp.]